MAALCREFGISRKTGYKVRDRYLEEGLAGLMDRSRRPQRSPNRTPKDIVELIVGLREARPTWGPKKLRWYLERHHLGVALPAESTIAVILKREGLVKGRRRRCRASPTPGPLEQVTEPNQVWAMDFKGQFRLGNRKYCYPLTVTDQHSRYLLCCDALESTRWQPVQQSLRQQFRSWGLPNTIRTDNGAPFASTGRCGMTALSVWMMRHGIRIERIQPGKPQQNGRHERMHRTLKAETTRPASDNLFAQQERFDVFLEDFNEVRPHEALGMKPPSQVYQKSKRTFNEHLPPLDYPLHDFVAEVYKSGDLYFSPMKRRVYIGQPFAGARIGLRELEGGCWIAHFMDLELGYIDPNSRAILPSQPRTT